LRSGGFIQPWTAGTVLQSLHVKPLDSWRDTMVIRCKQFPAMTGAWRTAIHHRPGGASGVCRPFFWVL